MKRKLVLLLALGKCFSGKCRKHYNKQEILSYSFSFSTPSQSNQLQKCFSNLFSSLIPCSSTQKGLQSIHKVLNLFKCNSECFICHTNLFAPLIHSLFFNCARSTSKCKLICFLIMLPFKFIRDFSLHYEKQK